MDAPHPKRMSSQAMLLCALAVAVFGVVMLWLAKQTAAPDPTATSLTETTPATAAHRGTITSPSSTIPAATATRSSPAASTNTTPHADPSAPAEGIGPGDPTWATSTSKAAMSVQAAQDARWVHDAEAFVKAYARPVPGVSREQWWQQVRPLLSASAVGTYAGVDPSAVTFTRVTGAGGVVEPDTEAVDAPVQVMVPTDGGWRLVTVDAQGRVARIEPVDAVMP